jgi:hypothetical protein
MADLEQVGILLRSDQFLDDIVSGFLAADVNLSGRLTLDEFAPLAGRVLRIITRPTLNPRTNPSRWYEHSP